MLRLRTFLLFLALACVCFSGMPSDVSAVEHGGLGGKPVHRDPSDARTESWFILTAEPGATVHDELLVVNNTSEIKEVELYPADTAKASGGGFALKQKLDRMKEIGVWTKVSSTRITLAPHTELVVPFYLTVPADVSPGEYAGALIVQEVAPPMQMGSGIALSLRMGVRIYLTVPGVAKHVEMTPLEPSPEVPSLEVVSLVNQEQKRIGALGAIMNGDILPVGFGLGLAGLFGCTTYVMQRRKKRLVPQQITKPVKKSYARPKKRTKV